VPAMSPTKAPRTPTTPVRPTQGPSPMTTRSPSMPSLVTGQGRPRGATESSPSVPRSQAAMVMAGLTPQPQPRPQSMMLPSLPSTPSTAGAQLSRRAHLIREIANTERAHATDLILIRDAYIGRDSPLVGHASRPDSQHSSNTQYSSNDHSAASTPGLVDSRPPTARRNSSYGMPVEELRRPSVPSADGARSRPNGGSERLSGHENSFQQAWNGLKSPVRKNPQPNGSFDQLVTSPATASTSSVTSAVFPSPRFPTPQSSFSRVGKPLPPADVKAVFLNLTQLATLSEELATEFERALGSVEDELMSPGGEGGSDRLGEVFCQMVSVYMVTQV